MTKMSPLFLQFSEMHVGDIEIGDHSYDMNDLQSPCLMYLLIRTQLIHTISNWANAFCFLSSLTLLPTASMAVFGSYLSFLYS